jgi:flagellar biosynthesis/type III secretory pathway protein FliH
MLDIARADVAQELALMRIAALEAFERASADLLGRLARDVLARELALAPADLCALAARALAVLADHEPIALVVAPGDVAALQTTLPVRADAALEPGDLIVEVRDGAFESRFALRVNETVATTAAESLS